MSWQFVVHPNTNFCLCLTLMHALWQASLAAIISYVVGRWFPKLTDESRYWLHVASLILSLVAVPVTYVWISSERAASPTIALLAPKPADDVCGVVNTVPSRQTNEVP